MYIFLKLNEENYSLSHEIHAFTLFSILKFICKVLKYSWISYLTLKNINIKEKNRNINAFKNLKLGNIFMMLNKS